MKFDVLVDDFQHLMSLSSRRAWIEIPCTQMIEGVAGSLSSRRAWIEIFAQRHPVGTAPVALLAEGVD